MRKPKLVRFIEMLLPVGIGIFAGILFTKIEKNISLENKKEWALVGYEYAADSMLRIINAQIKSDTSVTKLGIVHNFNRDTTFVLFSPKLIDSMTYGDFKEYSNR